MQVKAKIIFSEFTLKLLHSKTKYNYIKGYLAYTCGILPAACTPKLKLRSAIY